MKSSDPEPGAAAKSITAADHAETLADQTQTPTAAPPAPHSLPTFTDHELLVPIGKGSYGEVWLARNVMGAYRAVKIVYRDTFEHARPFERGFERNLAVWDLDSRQKLVEFTAHNQAVGGNAFSHDGKLLATTGVDGLAKIWNWRTQQEIASFRGTLRAARSVAFSPDDRRLAVGSDDGVQVWDLETKREVAQLFGQTHWTRTIAFLDENTLFSASGNEAIIWRAPSFNEIEASEKAGAQK